MKKNDSLLFIRVQERAWEHGGVCTYTQLAAYLLIKVGLQRYTFRKDSSDTWYP